MANPYYDHTTFPSPNSAGSSAAMRTELDLIEQGFDKLPTLSGNANKLVAVNASETALEPVANDVTLPGGLTVNGNVTLGDSGSDLLTIAASAVTWSNDPTHSGNHTFSGGVTLSGGNPTLSAGTANGVAYLNGSKVLTSGSALTFDGTNLGIGTASPISGAYLDVVSSGTAYPRVRSTTATAAATYYQNSASGTTNTDGLFVGIDGSLNGYLYNYENAPLVFGSNGSEQMRLTSTGLGIGTSSPGYKLDVNGTAAISGAVTLSAGTANGVAYLDGSKVLTSGSALTFDGTNLGVLAGSVTSPAAKIHAVGNVRASTGTGTVYTQLANDGVYSTGTDLYLFAPTGYSQIFYANNAEGMRLTSTGLGIGTSSPAAKFETFDSAVSAAFAPNNPATWRVAQFRNNGTANANNAAGIAFVGRTDVQPAGIVGVQSTTGGGVAGLAFLTVSSNTTAESMRLDSSGNLGLGVTPSAWTLGKAFEIGVLGTAVWNVNNDNVVYTQNAYYQGGWKYARSAVASCFDQNLGAHRWFTAPSGTAGNAISFTQAMTLDASGNLGIGTSSPSSKLHVDGQIEVTTDTTTPTAGSAYFYKSSVGATVSGFSAVIETGSAGSRAERLRIDSSGNLGLGVTPSAWSGAKALQISGGGLNGALYASSSGVVGLTNNYYNAGGDVYVDNGFATRYYQFSGQHVWNTAPSGTAGNAISFTQAMTLDASGNWMVGVTTAIGRATVVGGSSQLAFHDGNGSNTNYGLLNYGGSSGELTLNANSSGGNTLIRFLTSNGGSNTERARITSGGDLLVGTTTAPAIAGVSTNHALVSGTGGRWLTGFQNTTTGTPWGIAIEYSAATPNDTSSNFLYCYDSAPALRMSVRSNGGIANYQSNNVDLSDIRTKTNISPIGSYWNKIAGLEIVTYKYKDQTHNDLNIGVIAQQVEQIAPEFVDLDGFGETPEDGVPLKMIYNKDLTFAAIKALQEAMVRIEQLEARVAALESN